MKETQGIRIISYMLRHGSITPYEAFSDLGITKLATRVGELRRKGVEIDSTRETRANRFGDNVTYMRYFLRWPDGGVNGGRSQVDKDHN